MPPNSVTISPTLATAKAVMANAVSRRSNSSRMSAASPFPLYTDSRATISWTTTYATVMSTIRNKVR